MSFDQALGAGLDPGLYEGRDVPEGSWVGRLDYKVWTRSGGGLSCYFTRCYTGAGVGARGGASREGDGGASERASSSDAFGAPERYRLAAFRLRTGSGTAKAYTAKDGAVDFADDAAAPGDRFVVGVGRSRTGGAKWVSAERVGPERGGR